MLWLKLSDLGDGAQSGGSNPTYHILIEDLDRRGLWNRIRNAGIQGSTGSKGKIRSLLIQDQGSARVLGTMEIGIRPARDQ